MEVLKAPVEAVEGALPKVAGANFTWDSVRLNLRSVFGEGGGWGGEGSWGEGQHRNPRKREGVETEQYARREEGRSEIWKWWREVEKPKRTTASRYATHSREKKGCFVQRVALVQDECQGFWAGSVINTCNGPNDDKLCLRGKDLEETLRPLSFWSNEVWGFH